MKPSQGQATAAGLLLAVCAAVLAHRFVLDLELMGWDSYPLIAASRVSGLRDLLGSFTEELMDGRYPHGSFYRPVTNLAFAFDYATSELDPSGYQRTNLLLHVAGLLAVFALGRRWLGAGPGSVVAALVFAVHPLQLETVPVAARRADMLFTLFLVLALLAQPTRRGASPLRLAAAALLVLLSAASKETGAVALPVVAGAVFLLPEQGDARRRAADTVRLAAPAAAGFALFLVLRTLVLQGLGGHASSAPVAGAVAGLAAAPHFARSLLVPQPWAASPAADTVLFLGLGAGLAVALAAAVRAEALPDAGRPSPGRLAATLGFWLACLLAMTGISGERASWYAVPFLPAYALLLGLVVDAAPRDWSRRRSAALLAAGWVALIVGSHLRFSPLFHRYEEWDEVNGQARSFLERFDAALAGAEPGTTLRVEALPLGTGAPLERVGVRSALCMADYSVAAYAELAAPERSVRVRLHTGGAPSAPTPGIVTVDAVPLDSPVLRQPGAPR